jgi:hypothetical protein
MISRARFHLFATFAVGAILSHGPLPAQTIPSPFRFIESRQEGGLFGGYISPGTGRFGFGPGPGPAWGARYGVNVSGPFGLEAVVTHSPTHRDIIDPGRVEGDRVVGEIPSDLVMIDGRLRFSLTGDRTWHLLSPFLAIGGGLVFDAARDNSDDELLLADDRFNLGTSFVGILAGGLRWFPGERFLVRGDFSLTIWQLKTPRGYSDPERAFTGVDEKEWVSGPSFTLGLGFRF